MKRSILKIAILICISFNAVVVKAQFPAYLADVNGKLFMEQSYTDVEGSPYLNDLWLKGAVKAAGKSYDNMELKYDQVTDVIVFKNPKGEMLNFVDPVDEFKLYVGDGYEMVFRSGFKPSDIGSEKTFYQVLTAGETPLIKRTFKKVIEYKEYNSATGTKKFDEIQNYYLVKNGVPKRIKKDKKSVLEVFGDSKTELEAFIKSNNINFKSDPDLIKLTMYYNSLK